MAFCRARHFGRRSFGRRSRIGALVAATAIASATPAAAATAFARFAFLCGGRLEARFGLRFGRGGSRLLGVGDHQFARVGAGRLAPGLVATTATTAATAASAFARAARRCAGLGAGFARHRVDEGSRCGFGHGGCFTRLGTRCAFRTRAAPAFAARFAAAGFAVGRNHRAGIAALVAPAAAAVAALTTALAAAFTTAFAATTSAT